MLIKFTSLPDKDQALGMLRLPDIDQAFE